ncbi:hypothetical protein [Nocardia puris]|uniref:hypothetical protein n=1 Tax=Nocardia puris TaxID=208602 RepID=UPI002E1C01D2
MFASSVLDDLERQGVSERDIRTALGWREKFRETYDAPWPGMRSEHEIGSFARVAGAEHERGVVADRPERAGAERSR